MPPRPFTYNPPDIPLDIIYYDDDILLLNKPHGLLSVAGNKPHLKDCLELRAKKQFPSALIVHRLDKDTSGIMVFGLNKKAHANLGLQFEKRQIKKIYIANIWGILQQKNGVIDEPIYTDWENRPMQKIDYENGKQAITNWQVINFKNNNTRIELSPITGRSHQLRVHMLSLGHPILGDNLYAHDRALNASSRLLLHAQSLSFLHPTNNNKATFKAPCSF